MTTDALQKIWKAYLNAYGDVAADERERLLRQSVADDVVFTGPNEDDQGFGKLVEHIGQFQKKSPGARFESNKLLTQHGQLLSEWALGNNDGAKIATGHTYARCNEQGRLTHLAGFLRGAAAGLARCSQRQDSEESEQPVSISDWLVIAVEFSGSNSHDLLDHCRDSRVDKFRR